MLNKLKRSVYNFTSARAYLRNWPLLGLRKMLKGFYVVKCWVHTRSGAWIWLDDDYIDDIILGHMYELPDLFFPGNITYENNVRVLDLGSHHGIYIIELLQRNPGLKAVCVEPVPRACSLLLKMAEKNNMLHRIELHECAVGTDDGEGVLVEDHEGSWGNKVLEEKKDGALKVKLKKLDQIVQQREFKMVKCNTEGGEYVIIPQLIKLGLKPELIILMTHGPSADQQHLLQTLEHYGYEKNLVNDVPENPGWHLIKK